MDRKDYIDDIKLGEDLDGEIQDLLEDDINSPEQKKKKRLKAQEKGNDAIIIDEEDIRL